jgi:hypothetical protein
MRLQTPEPAEYFNRAAALGDQARARKIECAYLGALLAFNVNNFATKSRFCPGIQG